jgi:Na+/H+ antiporter NhaC
MGANFKSMFKNLIIPVLFSMMVGYFMTCIFLVYKENKTKQTKERLLQGVASKTPEELIEEENEMNDLLNERLKIYGSIFLFLSFIVSILIFTIYKGTEDGRQNGLEISFMFTIKVFASLVLAVYIVHLLFK